MNKDKLFTQGVELFITHKEICGIYYYTEGTKVELFILLNNEVYNFELMHELYNIERQVEALWDGKNIEFHYAPEKYIDKKVLSKFTKYIY